MNENEMRIALSYYVELTKQILPALVPKERAIVEAFNKDVEKKLKHQ